MEARAGEFLVTYLPNDAFDRLQALYAGLWLAIAAFSLLAGLHPPAVRAAEG